VVLTLILLPGGSGSFSAFIVHGQNRCNHLTAKGVLSQIYPVIETFMLYYTGKLDNFVSIDEMEFFFELFKPFK
jgi:hypothetical protein